MPPLVGGRFSFVCDSCVRACAFVRQVMTGMIRGLRKPPTNPQHLGVLQEALVLLHVPNIMVDDRTPLLELYHRPLCLALVALVECAPLVATGLLRAVVSHFPSSSSANSSKEVGL